jgi:hypothetical protein
MFEPTNAALLSIPNEDEGKAHTHTQRRVVGPELRGESIDELFVRQRRTGHAAPTRTVPNARGTAATLRRTRMTSSG